MKWCLKQPTMQYYNHSTLQGKLFFTYLFLVLNLNLKINRENYKSTKINSGLNEKILILQSTFNLMQLFKMKLVFAQNRVDKKTRVYIEQGGLENTCYIEQGRLENTCLHRTGWIRKHAFAWNSGGLRNMCMRGTGWVRKHVFECNRGDQKTRVCMKQFGKENTCLHGTGWIRKHMFAWNRVDKKTRVYIEQACF